MINRAKLLRPQRVQGSRLKVPDALASNLLPPSVGSPKAAAPSPGLRPPSPQGRGMGALRKLPG